MKTEEQKCLARRLVSFLSQYTHLSDSYVIEFFTEDLWQTLPLSWQLALQDITYPQIADLLLDVTQEKRSYPSVWPLSLLAFRATAHGLAFPRECRCERSRTTGLVKSEEFLENSSQSSLLGHLFRKHVKPKKQHEIRRLGMLVKQLCERTDCSRVVDVGSGQGHLTRFMSFGLGLSVTAIEASGDLVAMATKFDEQLLWTLKKDVHKKDTFGPPPLPQSIPHHVTGWVNPKASWEVFIKQLKARYCVSESPTAPRGPCKKRLRGSEHVERHRVAQVLPSHGSNTDSQNSDTLESAETLFAHPVHGAQPDFILTGLHACGDLSTTLLRHFVHCPHIRGITSVACCYMKITTRENPSPPGVGEAPAPPSAHDPAPSSFGYPMSCFVQRLPGHQLSYKAREGACHALEDYVRRLREGSDLLRTHCYRATLETFVRDARPDLRRAGIQTIRKAHLLAFTEYARLGLVRVGLPPDLPLDPQRVAALLQQQGRVVVYFSLSLLLAPVVESLVLLDRMIYLKESGIDSHLVPLFDPNFSPRNFVLMALKPGR